MLQIELGSEVLGPLMHPDHGASTDPPFAYNPASTQPGANSHQEGERNYGKGSEPQPTLLSNHADSDKDDDSQWPV